MMDDEKLKDIALNFQANISDKLLKENMDLKKEIEALQTQIKESQEIFNKTSAPESMLNADLISRQDVLDIIEPYTDIVYVSIAREIKDQVANLPSVTPQKVGKWIPVSSYEAFGGDEITWSIHGNPIAYHYCSECKVQTRVNEFGEEILSKYCPDCGARMLKEGE